MRENWETRWKDYYKILQVHPTAEQEVIKAAYDRLARKYHPDLNNSPAANQRMTDLNEAFEILNNIDKRRHYHSSYLQKKGMDSSVDERPSVPSRPKPIVDPRILRFQNMKKGEVKRGTFIIRNVGGPYSRIWLSEPGSWVRIVRQIPKSATEKLPLAVEIEAKGDDWGKSYVDHIIIRLDDIETHVRIELQIQPEPVQENVGATTTAKPDISARPGIQHRNWLLVLGCVVAAVIITSIILLRHSNTPTSTTAGGLSPYQTPTQAAQTTLSLVPSPTLTQTEFKLGTKWWLIQPMSVPRGYHSATLTKDGRVLVAGGYTSRDVDAPVAEIFNPVTDKWQLTGHMQQARHSQSATLLLDGRVLVVGGYAGTYLKSAEIWDPGTGLWTSTQPLLPHGIGHAATLLLDGRVLVTGGETTHVPTTYAEIFDPVKNSWQQVKPLAIARDGHSAVLLRDGRVLIAGGSGDVVGPSVGEVYDPIHNNWTPTSTMHENRNAFAAGILLDGRVLAAGGFNPDTGQVNNSAEVYDPQTNNWSLAAPLVPARVHSACISLPGGQVLVVGGATAIERFGATLLNRSDVFDPKSGMWIAAAAMNESRVNHISVLLPDGRILSTGGQAGRSSFLSSAEVLKP